MVEFMNWFLSFFQGFVYFLLDMAAPDGYSFGYMLLGVAIVSVVITGTIGAVGIFARNAQSDSRRSSGRNHKKGG